MDSHYKFCYKKDSIIFFCNKDVDFVARILLKKKTPTNSRDMKH